MKCLEVTSGPCTTALFTLFFFFSHGLSLRLARADYVVCNWVLVWLGRFWMHGLIFALQFHNSSRCTIKLRIPRYLSDVVSLCVHDRSLLSYLGMSKRASLSEEDAGGFPIRQDTHTYVFRRATSRAPGQLVLMKAWKWKKKRKGDHSSRMSRLTPFYDEYRSSLDSTYLIM